jgi:hypothetical protein
VPIRLAGSDQVVGAYEIYHDLSVLDPIIASTRRFVWFGVGLGFLVLYGALFVLVRNASRELTRRNNENHRLRPIPFGSWAPSSSLVNETS